MLDTSPITDPYLVKTGDTLSAIARHCRCSAAELQRYNKIANPNRLEVGQTLYLSKETAFGVSVLFLDALRHPIQNLAYRLHIDEKMIQGMTDQTGAVLNKISENAHSKVEVWIKNADNQWQQLTNTVSGYGHKLITLVSGFVVIKGQTEKLPHGAPPKPVAPPPPPAAHQAKPPAQPPKPKPPTGAPSKNNPHVKTKTHKGPQGQSVITVGVEIPEGLMAYFQNYTGEMITEDNWTDTAAQLICEKEVLKAIAQVETKGGAFVKINSHDQSGIMPTILYERHVFHRQTCANGPHANTKHHKYHGKGVPGCHSPYDENPDICYPNALVRSSDIKGKLHAPNSNMPDGTVELTDQYGSRSYLRLINAYRLNADAALQACSWGKFQIMGEEHQSSCGLQIGVFMKGMCTEEVKQLELLRHFIEHKAGGKLLKAVREKDWHKIAIYYNGDTSNVPGSYTHLLENAYEKLKKNVV